MLGSSVSLAAVFLTLVPLAALPLAAEEIQGDSYWGSVEEGKGVEPVAPVLHDTSALFGWEDTLYQLSATDAPGRSAQQVLVDAIAELAPGLSIDCFSRWTTGSWTDLAAAGLGDPRPALPASYAPAGMNLTYYKAPTLDCSMGEAAEPWPTRFEARFADPAGSRLDLRAEWTGTNATATTGRLTASSATWSHGHLAYVVAFDNPAIGADAVTAVARALDPAFQKECTRWVSEGTAARLSDHGIHTPIAPAGFEEISGTQTVRAAPGGCTEGDPIAPEIDADWVFAAGNVLLEVGATRDETVKEDLSLEGGLVLADGSVRWTDTQGTAYYVFSHTLDDGPALSQEDLFAVARSLDPDVPLP